MIRESSLRGHDAISDAAYEADDEKRNESSSFFISGSDENSSWYSGITEEEAGLDAEEEGYLEKLRHERLEAEVRDWGLLRDRRFLAGALWLHAVQKQLPLSTIIYHGQELRVVDFTETLAKHRNEPDWEEFLSEATFVMGEGKTVLVEPEPEGDQYLLCMVQCGGGWACRARGSAGGFWGKMMPRYRRRAWPRTRPPHICSLTHRAAKYELDWRAQRYRMTRTRRQRSFRRSLVATEGSDSEGRPYMLLSEEVLRAAPPLEGLSLGEYSGFGWGYIASESSMSGVASDPDIPYKHAWRALLK